MSAENKVTMTRVIVGVASVGATLALVYLYNKYQERKSKKGGAMGGSRVRRQSSKSGEVKKVTFKESHGDGSQKERDKLASSCGTETEAASESNTQGDAGKGVSPEDYDASTFRKEMRIPREIVSALIGKKGCNIKGIQAQSGTTINFHDQTLENGDRMCVIRGAPGNVTVAESLIEKFIIEQPTVYTEMLTVPTASVGRIIGRGGETIRSIQDLSKARVIVESHNHYGTGDSGPTRSITIKGSEEQINIAKQLIIEKVDEERNLRKSIDVATANRTHRRGGGASPSFPSPPGPTPTSATPNSASIEPVLPLKQDGILEVFVSCVYHPNDFWIQVVGRDSIELDKLCESMTDYYSGRHNEQGEPQYNVGDIVAAPFEVDGKIYRAKIMRIDDKGAEVSYLDYGDRRVLPLSEIYELHSNFLQLRFQAIQATLNLGCIGEKWEDDVINEFCDLTYCAQWQSLTARVKDYLKDVEDGHDVIWIELLDKETNIGEELVRKGLATPKGPSGCNGAQGSQKKSYAAAALGLSSNTAQSSQPLISSSDPTVQESLENERNGN